MKLLAFVIFGFSSTISFAEETICEKLAGLSQEASILNMRPASKTDWDGTGYYGTDDTYFDSATIQMTGLQGALFANKVDGFVPSVQEADLKYSLQEIGKKYRSLKNIIVNDPENSSYAETSTAYKEQSKILSSGQKALSEIVLTHCK